LAIFENYSLHLGSQYSRHHSVTKLHVSSDFT